MRENSTVLAFLYLSVSQVTIAMAMPPPTTCKEPATPQQSQPSRCFSRKTPVNLQPDTCMCKGAAVPTARAGTVRRWWISKALHRAHCKQSQTPARYLLAETYLELKRIGNGHLIPSVTARVCRCKQDEYSVHISLSLTEIPGCLMKHANGASPYVNLSPTSLY